MAGTNREINGTRKHTGCLARQGVWIKQELSKLASSQREWRGNDVRNSSFYKDKAIGYPNDIVTFHAVFHEVCFVCLGIP